MNKIIVKLSLIVLVLSSYTTAYSQFDLEEIVKEKVKDRVEKNAEEGVDKGLDELEKAAKDSVKKAENNPKQNDSTSIGGTISEEMKSYSKYDFIPGEQVLYFEDFSKDAIGDFPAKWNTNASGEIVTIGTFSEKWLKTSSEAIYRPIFKTIGFPDNYTIEYDAVFKVTDGRDNLDITLYSAKNEKDLNPSTGYSVRLEMNAGTGEFGAFNYKDGVLDANNSQVKDVFQNNSKIYHIAIWVQKQRLRLFINENKVFDLPMLIPELAKLNAISFYSLCFENKNFISNIRIAAAAPDMRNKLLTEGKLVTHGILFDVNSDKIKGESYGTLKEISQVLKDNPNVKVKIIGHTDGDGNATSNLDLSKRRAASVKSSLSKDFGIDDSRMVTDGKGSSVPTSPNTTSEGKANNRRVEFVKL